MRPDELLADIKHKFEFPRHGWVADNDNCIYLLFPILRAIWELAEEFINGSLAKPLHVRDFYRMGHFQRLLIHRICPVLGKIARAEELILSGADRDGAPIEEWGPVKEAEDFLPIWIEFFYIYFRLLADYLTVALGTLVSKSPSSFPTKYKTLLKAAREGTTPISWKMKVDADAFLRAIRENSDWFRMLAESIDKTKKGIRDTILHRLVRPMVIRVLDEGDTPKRIEVRFEASDSDVPDIDIFAEIPLIIGSFCDCLSALPPELWKEQKFHIADLTIRGHVKWKAVTRFFPRLLCPK